MSFRRGGHKAVVSQAERQSERQRPRPFRDPCTFDDWPAPVTVIASRGERVFPVEFQQRLARERLGIDAVVVPGGHLVALSHPVELSDAILAGTNS